MQKETLSALMDGETLESRSLNALSNDTSLQATWQSYHLIRDTLRNDMSNIAYSSIVNRVATELKISYCDPLFNTPVESQPEPHRWSDMPFWNKIRPWMGQLIQIGVAASVCLAVIVGVQQYNGTTHITANTSDSPVLNTMPMGGFAAPVSYGVPSEGGGQLQQLQEQRKRVNALLQGYELQRRLQTEQLREQNLSASTSTTRPPASEHRRR